MQADIAGVPVVEARWYRRAVGSNVPVRRIVIHSVEAHERPDTAEAVAGYFAATDRKASAHYVVDADSAVQCVPEGCVAYHAPPNAGSIGIEHAGFARQTTAEWLDPYGRAMLALSARLAADVAVRHRVPVVRLSPGDLVAGRAGFAAHADVSRAFRLSTHTDPGKGFPWDWYLARVRVEVQAILSGIPAGGTDTDPMALTLDDAQVRRIADAVAARVSGAHALHPVVVDPGTGSGPPLADGRDTDPLPTVVGEIQHELRLVRAEVAVLRRVLVAVAVTGVPLPAGVAGALAADLVPLPPDGGGS